MKKGFTLVELLAVMVIISIVSIITVPTVTDLLNKNKTKLCNAQIDEIISAAKSWGTENVFSLPNNDGGSITISLKKLSEEGYIDEKIKNPVTNGYFDLDETVVTITKNGKKYSYTMNDSVVDTCYSNGVEKSGN